MKASIANTQAQQQVTAKQMAVAANLDTSTSVSAFLKDNKILNELSKGVMSLKSFVYPSVLQKEAIPVLKKKNKSPNVIIRYSSMSGIKLTVLIPLLNQLIRDVVSNPDKEEAQFLAILCHSGMRCTELEGFLKELLTFCQDAIEIIDLYNGDKVEINHRLKQALATQATSDVRASVKARCKVLISTPNQFIDVLKVQRKGLECHSLYLDKVDMHCALDLSNELLKVSELMDGKPTFKTIMTTQFKGAAAADNDQEQTLKKAFMGDAKALIIQLNDDQRVKSKLETLEHYYIQCQSYLEKFIVLFTFLKLGILEGKTVIYTNDVIQAYRIKLFLNRFALKSFVLSPELPKNQFKSLIHFFHIGQFNIMIVLQAGYSMQPQFKTVSNIVNFDAPPKYNQYKEAGGQIDSDNGAILTLVQPSNKEEVEALQLYQRKMQKAFNTPNMIKCIPMMWQELIKIKSRVEDIIRTLDNKTVKTEKINEFKKQLISNGRLKEYFNQHPEEKEILINDLAKNDTNKHSIMYKHLSFLPSYVIPTQIMAITMDQIRNCTTGTLSALPGNSTGSLNKDRTLTGTLITSNVPADNVLDYFADPDTAQSSLIQNLASLPAVVRTFNEKNQEGTENADKFASEEPTEVNFEALQPTSGRKIWKMRHHKPLKKKLKPAKNGYQGS